MVSTKIEQMAVFEAILARNRIPNAYSGFKGTNTVERIAAGKAVLSELSKNNNLVFVSTHDVELTDLLSEEYELYHFSERIENESIDFDYLLKKGKLKNRNAIRILQINNYPGEVVEDALKVSKKLDKKYSGKGE